MRHGEAAGVLRRLEVSGSAVVHASIVHVERRRHIEVPTLGTAPPFRLCGDARTAAAQDGGPGERRAIRAGAARRQRQRRRNG